MKKEYVLLGILSVILLAAGIWIYQIVSEYQKAEQEYEQLTPIHNSEMDVIRGYLKTKGIFLREEKLPDEVEIGFENVD